MNSQRTVILAIGAAVIMVACAVLGVAIVDDNSTSTNTNQNVSDSQYTFVNDNTDNADLIGESIHTEPKKKTSIDVGTNHLQYFLAEFVSDYGDMNFYDFMMKKVFYKCNQIRGMDELAQILEKEGFAMEGKSVRMDYSENSICALNGLTVKEFAEHAVSNTIFEPFPGWMHYLGKWRFNPIEVVVG